MLEFATITGRRVTIAKMTGEEERQLLRAAKGGGGGNARSSKRKQRENSAASIRALIDKLVIEAEPPIDHSTLLLGEEMDLLYLIRLASLGPLYDYRTRCPDDDNCGKISDYTIDIRAMRRHVLQCSDETCTCQDLRDYSVDDLLSSECLAADFSYIEPNHFADNPKLLTYELPVTGTKVTGRLAKAHYKDALGRWADDMDEQLLSKALAQVTESIDGVTDARGKVKLLGELPSLDRFWLRDQLQDAEPGVDNEIEMCCSFCGVEFSADVAIAGNFFLPKRVVLVGWFVSLLRYQRETGKSLESWVSHSKNDKPLSMST